MNFKKYFFVVGVLILAMMRPGLKTGVKNDFVWSEIKSGFGEQGQEFPIPTTNSQEYPLPLPPPGDWELRILHGCPSPQT